MRGSAISVALKGVARAARCRIAIAMLAVAGVSIVLALPVPSFAAQQVPGAQRPISSPQTQSSGPVTAESNPQLFATLCALYAAGFQSGASVPNDDPAFTKLRDQLLALNGPATEALRNFYRQHVLADSGETLSRYITYALVAGPPPRFSLTLGGDDLPPDVLDLSGFDVILANFYAEAGVDKLWDQFQPAYQEDVDSLRAPLSTLVQLETGYLREIVSGNGRTFTVYVEPLVGGRTNVRNVGSHYVIVVSPAADSLGQIRHAFLHFLLDPLPLRYAQDVHKDEPLLQYAAKAPRLPSEFRADFPAFFTECFVRAVELRLRHLSADQQSKEVADAEGQGYVLIRPILASLAKFEKSEPSMSLYFPDLLHSINLPAEVNRVQTLAFLPGVPVPEPGHREPNAVAANQPALSPDVAASFAEGERQIATQDAAAAAATFQRVLDKIPGQPRALYGLAVASVLQGNADRARQLFEQIVASTSAGGAFQADAVSLAWSHVYLGRMHDLAGERDQALAEYRAALGVTDAPAAARTAAQRGIDQGYQPAVPAPGSSQQ